MTRKDYVLIAATLRKQLETCEGNMEVYGALAVRETMTTMANALASDNPRFETRRFLDAAGYFTPVLHGDGTRADS